MRTVEEFLSQLGLVAGSVRGVYVRLRDMVAPYWARPLLRPFVVLGGLAVVLGSMCATLVLNWQLVLALYLAHHLLGR